MDKLDAIARAAEESGHADRFRNLRYVEREGADAAPAESGNAQSFEGRLDGEINVDLHGNLELIEHNKGGKSSEKEDEGGLKESGTYVLRNGKLVPGKGMVRE